MTNDPDRRAARIHVEDSGGGAQPVILLHSSGLSGRQWRRLGSLLVARGLRVLSPDLSGHGASPPWPEPRPFSFHEDVDQIVTLLRGLPEPAQVVGHSYGAFIALLAATAAPGAIRSLALFEPVTFGVLDGGADADALAELAAIDFRWGPEAVDRERWLRTFVDYWGGEGAWAALREEARAEFRRVGWVVSRGVRTLLDDKTPPSAYRALSFPVRLITGERSPLAAGRVVRRLGEVLPDASVTTLPDVGHMAPLSHADLVNEVVLDALTAGATRRP